MYVQHGPHLPSGLTGLPSNHRLSTLFVGLLRVCQNITLAVEWDARKPRFEFVLSVSESGTVNMPLGLRHIFFNLYFFTLSCNLGKLIEEFE